MSERTLEERLLRALFPDALLGAAVREPPPVRPTTPCTCPTCRAAERLGLVLTTAQGRAGWTRPETLPADPWRKP